MGFGLRMGEFGIWLFYILFGCNRMDFILLIILVILSIFGLFAAVYIYIYLYISIYFDYFSRIFANFFRISARLFVPQIAVFDDLSFIYIISY